MEYIKSSMERAVLSNGTKTHCEEKFKKTFKEGKEMEGRECELDVSWSKLSLLSLRALHNAYMHMSDLSAGLTSESILRALVSIGSETTETTVGIEDVGSIELWLEALNDRWASFAVSPSSPDEGKENEVELELSPVLDDFGRGINDERFEVSLLSGEDDILDEDDGEEDGDEDIDDDNDDDDMDDDMGDVRGGSGDDDESDGSHTQSESNSESKRARGDSQDSHRIDDEVTSMVETMMSLGLGFFLAMFARLHFVTATTLKLFILPPNDMGALVFIFASRRAWQRHGGACI